MNTKLTIRILFISTIMMLSGLACAISSLSFRGKSLYMEVTLSEEQLNTLISNSRDAAHTTENNENNFLDYVDHVELHDGYMQVFGSMTENGQTISGSIDVSVTASDGALQAQVISVDIPGKDINDPSIQQANEQIARQLANLVAQSQGDVTIRSIEVSEGELILDLKVKVIDLQ